MCYNCYIAYHTDIKLMEAEFECFDEAKGWKRLSQTEVAEVWKKSDGSPIPLIKVRVLYKCILWFYKKEICKYDFKQANHQRLKL